MQSELFLYSQDLSNYETKKFRKGHIYMFLYSQDLSNYKTAHEEIKETTKFLYSQDLSNYAVNGGFLFLFLFLYSQRLGNFEDQSIGPTRPMLFLSHLCYNNLE